MHKFRMCIIAAPHQASGQGLPKADFISILGQVGPLLSGGYKVLQNDAHGIWHHPVSSRFATVILPRNIFADNPYAIPQKSISPTPVPAGIDALRSNEVGSMQKRCSVLSKISRPGALDRFPVAIYVTNHGKREHIVTSAIGLIAAIEVSL
jgi:hypothetical protein